MKAALVGSALAHSISPEVHAAIWPIVANEYSRTDALTYDKIESTVENLSHTFDQISEEGFDGINLTFPFKEEIIQLCKAVSTTAAIPRSSNCVSLRNGAFAHSTDGAGLIEALRKEWGSEMYLPSKWVIYGAGGAARACALALMQIHPPEEIVIVVRKTSAPRAKKFEQLLRLEVPSCQVIVQSFEDLFTEVSQACLYLQATPLGQIGQERWPGPISPIKKDDSVIDLVYTPMDTEILREAKSVGARSFGGLGMLIEQAALSQRFWIDRDENAISPLSIDQYKTIRHQMSKILSSR